MSESQQQAKADESRAMAISLLVRSLSDIDDVDFEGRKDIISAVVAAVNRIAAKICPEGK